MAQRKYFVRGTIESWFILFKKLSWFISVPCKARHRLLPFQPVTATSRPCYTGRTPCHFVYLTCSTQPQHDYILTSRAYRFSTWKWSWSGGISVFTSWLDVWRFLGAALEALRNSRLGEARRAGLQVLGSYFNQGSSKNVYFMFYFSLEC